MFSVVGATFVSLVISLSLRRDTGELKRKRGTPVSPAVILAGIIGNGVVLSILMASLVIGLAVVLFGATVDLERLPELLLTLVVGALTFCALGAAVAAFVPNGDAAPAFANITIFPLYFISGVFIPDVPESLASIAGALPLRPFLLALSKVFNPQPRPAWTGETSPSSRHGARSLRCSRCAFSAGLPGDSARPAGAQPCPQQTSQKTARGAVGWRKSLGGKCRSS